MRETLARIPEIAELNKKITLPDGTGVEFKRKKKELPKAPLGPVATHEMHHVMVNPDLVLHVSIVPEGNSLGHTVFMKMDLNAAAGPAAMGDGGTGSDEAAVKGAGADWHAAQSAAGNELAGKEEYVQEIGAVLQAVKELSGAEIREMITDIKYGYEIEIIITHPNGTQEKRDHGRLKENTVAIPRNLLIVSAIEKDGFLSESELPRAAHDNEAKATRYQKAA
ncbi:MAG TPA: hypothetical protein VI957_02920 [Candidatus Paceibacterota bacterium]